MWMGDDRRLIMYPCSNNTFMNFVAIHPSELSAGANKTSGKLLLNWDPKTLGLIMEIGWGHGGSKELLREVYKDFEPRVQALLELVDADELKLWTLLDMDRIPTWHKEKLVLLGDAAHPFLPRKLIQTCPRDITNNFNFRPRTRWRHRHRRRSLTSSFTTPRHNTRRHPITFISLREDPRRESSQGSRVYSNGG